VRHRRDQDSQPGRDVARERIGVIERRGRRREGEKEKEMAVSGVNRWCQAERSQVHNAARDVRANMLG